MEAGRGHDTHNISQHDFFETYLAQYKIAFEASPGGVMCSCPRTASRFALSIKSIAELFAQTMPRMEARRAQIRGC